jgi:general L-amino acid transport system permease protein
LLKTARSRHLFFQLIFVTVCAFVLFFLSYNLKLNLEKQNIATGFDFLTLEAGFDIGETVVEYWPDDNYRWALFVGLLNTLKVSVVGIFFALFVGVTIAIGSLSKNILLSKISRGVVELIRNIPLLLQLLFWYALLTESLPLVKDAYEILPHTFVSNRGIFIPFFETSSSFVYLLLSFIISFVLFFISQNIIKKKSFNTGLEYPLLDRLSFVVFVLPFITWLSFDLTSQLSYPKLMGFNFSGGHNITPEFLALLLGLVLYTGVFIAEIIRAGIVAVDKGQWDACSSLSLSQYDTYSIVIIPQALKLIIPPLTSQFLNLIKNSSLAVAIGYPEIVSVSNTTMNQTGQAIECIVIIMSIYLFFSLSSSFVMNLTNRYFDYGGDK